MLVPALSAGALASAVAAQEPALQFVGPDRTLDFARSDILLAEAAYRPEAAAVRVCLNPEASRRLADYSARIVDQTAEFRVHGELLARLTVYEPLREPCAWYAAGDIDEAERLARLIYRRD